MSFAQKRMDLMVRNVNRVHKAVVKVSGGRVGSRVKNLTVVKLTTIGRKSGAARTVMLTAPIHGDGRYVLVASKGGDDRNPDWYGNLVANPEVTLDDISGDGPVRLIARTAIGDERAELWSRIIAASSSSSGYALYAEKTDREIPVVICDPPA
ncbi:MAG: nitroreductase/quinone reductase family protein [Ilumatobacter sp.]